MAEYRAYILNRNGKITEAADFVRNDDEAAKKHAREVAGGYDVELWQGKRRVALLKKAQE